MQEFCHRCGGDLPPGPDSRPSEAAYCPHCGAPQLTVLEPLDAEPEDVAAGDDTGAVPPPPKPVPPARGQGPIDWQRAIQIAALVAAIGCVLNLLSYRFAAAAYASSLWTVTVAFTTISLYARNLRDGRSLNGSVGARIGTVAGLLQCVANGISLAIAGVIGRYSLHNLQSFDAELKSRQDEAYSKLLQSVPEMNQIAGFIHSPEYRAGTMLAGILVGGALLVLFSMGAGALAGAVRRQRG